MNSFKEKERERKGKEGKGRERKGRERKVKNYNFLIFWMRVRVGFIF